MAKEGFLDYNSPETYYFTTPDDPEGDYDYVNIFVYYNLYNKKTGHREFAAL